MKAGIATKLLRTYLIIIVVTIVSGLFCLYVLKLNQHTNSEMRYVTLPSIENLKELKQLMPEIKKLSNSWVFIPNNKDQERLNEILNTIYPSYSKDLEQNSKKWEIQSEIDLYNQLAANNVKIIDAVFKIKNLLNNTESYTNDQLVDNAAELYTKNIKIIAANNKLYEQLIETKEKNLEIQQNEIGSMLSALYITLLFTIIIVLIVSLASMSYARQKITSPILRLKKIILDIAVGEVVEVEETERKDEIGQMHNAISEMINGIMQKIHFSEQIGKGDYSTDFVLQSNHDKLGIALLTMRNDLKKSNEILVEQDRRLIDAQKLAKVGNYLIDTSTKTFQSSATFDEIMGIDETFEKTINNWVSLIIAEERAYILGKGIETLKDRTIFSQTYLINKYKTGQEVWVSVIGENNYDEKGNPISIFGTMQDITASKTLELELNNSYKIATDQNRRLLNFSYIVSHNLRMHAVNINGLIKWYQECETDEERKETITMMEKASELLDETLHHLTDVVAMQNALSVDVSPQVLNKYINHAIDLLQTQISAKNAIINNNVSDDIIVNYNPAYLDSIVLNFISNALKYSHPQMAPIINIDINPEYPGKPNSRLILSIADNGIGIDLKKHGHKLFGMYKTFHGNKDAKGLGLFMTKYQVEAMGGQIEVESELTKGTTFKIYIK